MKNRAYPFYERKPELHDLRELLLLRLKESSEETAFKVPDRGDQAVKEITYREFYNDTKKLAEYLANSFGQGAHIAIFGDNSYEWLVLLMAIILSGNVAIALDKEMDAAELGAMLELTACRIIFAAKKQSAKIAALTGLSSPIKTYQLEDIANLHAPDAPVNLLENIAITQKTPCLILLTSGTDGQRKAVLLTHGNLVANINDSCKLFRSQGDTYTILPFHHAFGLMVGVLMAFYYGYTIFIGSGLKKLTREMPVAKPEAIAAVPLFLETFYKQIWQQAKKQKKARQLAALIKFSDFLLKFGIDLRRRFFKKIRAVFGGNLEYVICGGAMLDSKYVKAFRSFGIEILNGYGTTESSPVVACNRNHYH